VRLNEVAKTNITRRPLGASLLSSDRGPDCTALRSVGATDRGAVAHDLARRTSATWAAFALSGKPDNPSMPHWPSYTASDRATLILDRACRIANDYGAEARNLWKEITRVAS